MCYFWLILLHLSTYIRVPRDPTYGTITENTVYFLTWDRQGRQVYWYDHTGVELKIPCKYSDLE